eukprot:1326539-Alexandrium_andersonii.AAC.1
MVKRPEMANANPDPRAQLEDVLPRYKKTIGQGALRGALAQLDDVAPTDAAPTPDFLVADKHVSAA